MSVNVTIDERQVWLELADGVSVGIGESEARALDRKGFAKLYRQSVYRASRRDAKRWADEQVRRRDEALLSG